MQAAQLNTREEFLTWEQRCNEFIELLEEQSRFKRPRLSISKQSLIARIARLENLKDSVHERFVQVGAGYQFLEDASKIVLECMRDVMNIKINTVFNGEFVSGDKRANKTVSTRNFELFQTFDLKEWYVSSNLS
ncbi:hypothetical protein ALC60_01859 [Trachymyrmex zeteki]|uniref:Uncharacterized protein n=1 Tax=Mycetomoellerius zeteki TaxID=64791 RepID=A0A151XFM4_9HYME|nr:hypothetical protein ALC60_01859 [Trachymyrmex zeteki]